MKQKRTICPTFSYLEILFLHLFKANRRNPEEIKGNPRGLVFGDISHASSYEQIEI